MGGCQNPAARDIDDDEDRIHYSHGWLEEVVVVLGDELAHLVMKRPKPMPPAIVASASIILSRKVNMMIVLAAMNRPPPEHVGDVENAAAHLRIACEFQEQTNRTGLPPPR